VGDNDFRKSEVDGETTVKEDRTEPAVTDENGHTTTTSHKENDPYVTDKIESENDPDVSQNQVS
jgi:hypothetical protein